MTDATTHLVEASYPAGVDLLVGGQPSGRMYVLDSGSVRVHAADTEIAVITQPGAFLGEISVLLGGTPRATVTTIEPSTLRHTDDPLGYLLANPDVLLDVARAVATRLDLITGYLADLRTQYADRSDHLAVVTEVLQVLMHHRGTAIEPGSEREAEAPY